jgi:adenylosuccinate synthase
LSGPLAVGKTTLRDALINDHHFDYAKSGKYLTYRASQLGIPISRTSLQDLGDKLDVDTDYQWLINDVVIPAMQGNSICERWIVDAVRKERQVKHFRDSFKTTAEVLHLHLTAPEAVLKTRYESRKADTVSYAVACSHENEKASRALIQIADMICDTSVSSAKHIADEVLTNTTGKLV